MKILCSADWHLGAALLGREQLRQAQEQIPRRVAELCRQEGCDLVLLGGDLLDTPEDRESARLIIRAAEELKVPVMIAPGNHDYLCPESPYLTMKWPENVHIFTKPEIERFPVPALGCAVYGAGYKSMDCPPMLEHFRAEPEDTWRIGILHGDPTNPVSPCCPVTRQQVEAAGLHFLGLGHIHKSGAVRVGSTLCLWPGSPMGRDFGECGEKGCWIIELGERPRETFHSLGLPCFYELRQRADRLKIPAASGNYYRITVTGCREAPLPEVPGVTWIDRTVTPEEVWADAGADSFTGLYFGSLRRAWEAGDPDALRAAEISRQLLLGEEVSLC